MVRPMRDKVTLRFRVVEEGDSFCLEIFFQVEELNTRGSPSSSSPTDSTFFFARIHDSVFSRIVPRLLRVLVPSSRSMLSLFAFQSNNSPETHRLMLSMSRFILHSDAFDCIIPMPEPNSPACLTTCSLKKPCRVGEKQPHVVSCHPISSFMIFTSASNA